MYEEYFGVMKSFKIESARTTFRTNNRSVVKLLMRLFLSSLFTEESVSYTKPKMLFQGPFQVSCNTELDIKEL